MVLNYIWIAFFVIAFVIAVVRLIVFGDFEVFPAIMSSTFDTAKTAFEISLGLTGVLSLWMGIMKIGEKGGVVNVLARWLSPVFSRLFPDIPEGHPVVGNIFMNIAANMLGLDNAATPLGLKAMEGLQQLNPKKETASNAMIMFLVLNTSGLTIIPVSIMVYRAQQGAANPTDVFIPILLATFFSTLAGIIVTALFQRINLLNRTLLLGLGGVSLAVGGIIWGFASLDSMMMNRVGTTSANVLLFTIIIAFILAGLRKKVNVYEAFIEGAKTGFETAVRIIPYLVAILVAIGVFRASGAMDALIDGTTWLVARTGFDAQWVGALPTRSDGRCHDHLRRRLLRGTALLHLPGVYRHHVLHPRRLLRQRGHSLHAPRRGGRAAGRLGRRDFRHRHLLFVLRINHLLFQYIVMKTPISTEKAPAAIGPYSQAIEAGGMLFISGQLPVDPATGEFAQGGIRELTTQSLTNMQHILAEAGLTLDNVVKTTVFLADMADFAAMNEVYASFFKAPFPARSAVAVKTLPKGALVEIECIAAR